MSYSNDILDELRKTTSIVPDNTKKKKSSNDILDELRELAEADNEKRRKEQQKETLKSTVGTLGGDDDIAPVSTGKGVFDEGNKWYQGWVDKGALEDGFSAKNLAKTVLGTMNDNRETVTKAVIDATENLMDAGAHAVGTVGRIFSKDFQQKAYDFAAKDNFKSQETSEKIMRGLNWIDPIGVATNLLVDDTEEASVMGDKADGMLESAAHMVGSAALGYLGVPTWLTQGINAFSPAFEEAKEAGATDTQATINAGVAAVAEVLIEKLSGGIVSGTGADDLFLKPIVNKISNKFAAGLLKFTGKAALEGVEEVATEFATDVSKRLTYDKDVFKDEDTFDRYVTTFLSGALMGIGGQAVEVGQAKSAGRNYSTGMTDAEYSVVDKLINDEVAKREADGKRVSQYQKNKIENDIIEKMENGTIKVEEIESILGGDSYKTYDAEWNKLKSSDDWKALEKAESDEKMLPSLQQKYDELHKMKRGDMTGEQIDQETSLKSQIEAIQANKSSDLFAKLAPEANRVKQLRDKMRGEVSTMVKDSRLAESYRELERSKQDYTPDMTKYTNENAKKTVQNIIDSGLGNNSNAFRSKVDLLAKVSADTGVTYTLTKNSKLAGTEHYKIGYTTHGFIDDNGNIVINLDSDRLVETTAGHEVGHEFQKAGLDKKYSSILRDYCITKEGLKGYNDRIKAAEEAYKGKTNTTAEIEVANDLLGEYIFNDENFIKHLSTADRNVFQKVYDTIKYMCKIATAGSEEKRLLEKAKHEFEKAWREISKTKDANAETTADTESETVATDAKYSLSTNARTELHTALYDTRYRNDVQLRDVTPPIMLAQNGVKNLPMAMTASHIRENVFSEDEARTLGLPINEDTHYHGLGEDFFLDVIDGLDNVKLAYRGTKNAKDPTRRENYFLLISEFKHEGNTVNVPVYIDKKAQVNRVFIDANKISTVFGRDNFNDYIKTQIRRGDLVRIKNRDIKASESGTLIVPGYSNDVSIETKVAQESEKVKNNFSDSNIQDISTGYAYGETYFTMSYTQDGKVVGTLEYGDYEGVPNVKMIEVDPEYRRKGIGTKLLQSLQKKYPDQEINFGMRTPDGAKLLDAITYDVTDDAVVADKQLLSDLQAELDYLQERLDVLFDTENLTEAQEAELQELGDQWQEVYETIHELEPTIRGKKSTHTYVKYSMSKANDDSYFDAIDKGNIDDIQKLVDSAANASGFEVRAYHGTARGDRVGNEFRPDRATSGPMAFFTDNRTIAENYARDKADTSLAYDEEYSDYFTQFRVNQNGKSIKVGDLWRSLPYSEKQRIKEAGKHITWDDDMENIVWDDDATHGLGNWDAYTLNENKGNAINALIDSWLQSGELFNNEGEFVKVLELAGIKGVEYRDPDARHEKVYDVWMNIQNPFDTTSVSDEFVNGFAEWYNQQPSGKYERDTAHADMWDKNNQTAESFIERLRFDVFAGSTTAWTSIPDSMTDYLKSLGHDGIKDTGGKLGGDIHTVWIPFYSEQVKSAEPIVYDDNGKIIPLSERFDSTKKDIRFSMSKNGNERKSPFIESARDLTFHDPLDDFAPVRDDISPVANAKTEQNVPIVDERELFPDDLAPVAVELDALTERKANLENMMQEAIEAEDLEAFTKINEEYDSVMTRLDAINAEENERLSSLDDFDAPPVRSNYADRLDDSVSLTRKTTAEIAKEVKTSLGIPNKQMYDVHKLIEAYSNGEISSREQLYWELKEKFGTQEEKVTDERTKEVKSYLHSYRISVSDSIKDEIADFGDLQRRNRGRIIFSRQGVPVDIAYQEMAVSFPEFFPEDITNPTDQLMQILDVANSEAQTSHTIEIDDETLLGVAQDIMDYVGDVKYVQDQRFANQSSKAAFDALMEDMDDIAPVAGQPVQKQKAKTSEPSTVREKIDAKIESAKTELTNNQQNKAQSWNEYTEEINRLQYEYDSKQNKNSIAANNLLRRIEKLKRMRSDVAADYSKRISDIEKRLEKFQSPEYKRSEQRRAKYDEYKDLWENMLGDTSTWKDKALGLSYKTTTMRRFLRDVVRDEYGKKDFVKADAIYDELETKYDHNEALLKRESGKLKESFFDLKLNKVEDTYAHMLGEFRHNPETTLTQEVVEDYYNKHKNRIDTAKVDHAIEEARNTFDSLIVRVNEVLREQGMKEIAYRKGYFPHFQNPKQGFLGKLLNWKKIDNNIPTDIAGLTENFTPERSWQRFNKQRKGDTTDYSLFQGLDTYIHGALDWIYHIEDIQKRRALENYIRYIHSEAGVQEKIEAIRANETYDADEAQKQIELVLDEAKNPLNNLVSELRRRTNSLTNKKASGDRVVEEDTSRKVYSTLTNINNRVNANMVVGSFSSALTNFIPIVQSWHQVSPFYTVRGIGDLVRSAVKDDGMVAKSDFLTNRLVEEEKLYQTGWDKVSDKATLLMNVIDNITSQTVWRSKYLQNKHEGMSEAQAIKDADQFAKNVIAGRSRGNMPTIFDEKNIFKKMFTAFQLEVANQYGFMFKDTPQDSKNAVRLVKGYATAFLGAYLYNALYSSITGRDAAFDPIGIIEELLRDLGLGDDEEKKETDEVILNLAENIVDELPFVSGLTGGGRIPLSSAMPYSGDSTPFQSFLTDVGEFGEGGFGDVMKEMLNPLYYLIMPVGGGQVKKTVEGLSMFSDDHPVAGSYTDSGALRFPVEDTFGNKVKAALFGQWSSQNARDYIEQGRKPLSEKQLQEYIDLEMPIQDYWAYYDGLKKQETLEDKFDYIAGLDISVEQKNIMINNIVDRKDQVDMTNYDEIGDYEEFDFYSKNTEKYEFLQKYGVSYQEYTSSEEAKENYDSIYSWTKNYPNKVTVSEVITDNVIEYRGYTSALDNIRADKDENGKSISGSAKEKKKNYIFGLDLEDGQKYILFKSEYPADDTYNYEIIDYLNNRDDVSYSEMITILKELGFTIGADGKTITWD